MQHERVGIGWQCLTPPLSQLLPNALQRPWPALHQYGQGSISPPWPGTLEIKPSDLEPNPTRSVLKQITRKKLDSEARETFIALSMAHTTGGIASSACLGCARPRDVWKHEGGKRKQMTERGYAPVDGQCLASTLQPCQARELIHTTGRQPAECFLQGGQAYGVFRGLHIIGRDVAI